MPDPLAQLGHFVTLLDPRPVDDARLPIEEARRELLQHRNFDGLADLAGRAVYR